MPRSADTCVLCGRKATMIYMPHLGVCRFDCSEENGCTRFEISDDAKAYIENNEANVTDRLPFLSRAASRATDEGTGPIRISEVTDIARIAADQEGWEQSQGAS